MMVNFMNQLEWASGHLDIWSNIILGVSVEVGFFGGGGMKLTFELVD